MACSLVHLHILGPIIEDEEPTLRIDRQDSSSSERAWSLAGGQIVYHELAAWRQKMHNTPISHKNRQTRRRKEHAITRSQAGGPCQCPGPKVFSLVDLHETVFARPDSYRHLSRRDVWTLQADVVVPRRKLRQAEWRHAERFRANKRLAVLQRRTQTQFKSARRWDLD